VRLWRGEATELIHGSYALLDERGLTKAYVDAPGLCKAASCEIRRKPASHSDLMSAAVPK